MRLSEAKTLRARWPRLSVLVLAALLLSAGQAYAQMPNDASAVDQYVEPVPTGKGPSFPGVGKPKKKPLRPALAAAIQNRGGSDAALLTEIATSSVYGAPTGNRGGGGAAGGGGGGEGAGGGNGAGGGKGGGKNADGSGGGAGGNGGGAGGGGAGGAGSIDSAERIDQGGSAGEALSAAVSAVQGGDSGRMVGLFVALAAISLGALAAAGLRQRRRSL